MLSIPPPQRPPSRSERLLRETLRRDGEVRDPSTPSPPRRPSLTRHSTSRVASPPLPPLPPLDFYSRPSSPGQRCRYAELADEQYTRGNFLFRAPITNAPTSPHSEAFYSSKTESDGTVTPGSRTRFLDGKRAHSSRLTTRSSSPSPPPTKTKGTVTRRHSLQRASYHEQPLSPQEHALRARLGNMLRPTSVHMTNPNMAWDTNGELQWRDSDLPARSGSVSQPRSAASVRLFTSLPFSTLIYCRLRSRLLPLPQLPSSSPHLHLLSKTILNVRTPAAGAQQTPFAPLLTQVSKRPSTLPPPPHVLGQGLLQIRPLLPLLVPPHQCQASRRGETFRRTVLRILFTHTTLLTNINNTQEGNTFLLRLLLRLRRTPRLQVSAPGTS